MPKLFTRPWIGVLIIILFLAALEIYFVVIGFINGFSNDFLIKLGFPLLFFIPFAYIYTRHQSNFLGWPIFLTVLGIIILYEFCQLFGLNGVIPLFLGINLFFILYLYLRDSNKIMKSQEKDLHSDSQPQKYIEIDNTKPLQVNVENAIRKFKPSARYRYEIDYQRELYNWLSQDFQVQLEVQTGSSRPDLIIKNIAIEIKGPTNNRELDTLTTKFLKYSNHYPHFIIVLFDCSFSEGHFNEIHKGITKFAPHVIIIRK